MLTIEYIARANLIRFAIGYTSAEGPKSPVTIAENEKLLRNLKAADVAIVPSKIVEDGTRFSQWKSTGLAHLVEADSFSSFEDLKEKVLVGFTQHKPRDRFFGENKPDTYEFVDETFEQLNDYYRAHQTASLGS